MIKRKKAFTLMEMVLYIGAASIMILVTSVLLNMVMREKTKNETVAIIEDEGSLTMDIITRTIRNARSITTPAIDTNDTTLSLIVDEPLKNPTIFYINNRAIYMREGAQEPTPLTNASRINVTGILFQNIAGQSIHTQFNMEYKPNSAIYTSAYEYRYSKFFFGGATLR